MPFNIGQNDTWPPIQGTLEASGAPVDLTGATVRVNMKPAGGSSLTIDNATATILSAVDGEVEYAWQAADTSAAGSYTLEWEVTFATGKIATFPNTSDKIDVTIVAELG